MTTQDENNPDQTRWAEIINRLVDSLGRLAGDRLQLAGHQAGRLLSDALASAGVWAAAGAMAFLGLVFFSLATVSWLEASGLSPAGARFRVGAGLFVLAAAGIVIGHRLVTRPVATPAPIAAEAAAENAVPSDPPSLIPPAEAPLIAAEPQVPARLQ